MSKSSQAFRTIREVADWLGVAAHVLRFWESKFPQIKPVKRAGGRRYYRPTDMELVGGIKVLLHDRGLTIRGVQKMIREDGLDAIIRLSPPISDLLGDDVIEAGSTEDWVRDAEADTPPQGAARADDAPEAEQSPLPFDEAVTADDTEQPPEPAEKAPEPQAAPALAPAPAMSGLLTQLAKTRARAATDPALHAAMTAQAEPLRALIARLSSAPPSKDV